MKSILLFLFLKPFGLLSQLNYQQQIDKFIEAHVKVNHFSGVVLIAQNEKILFNKAYGSADVDLKILNTLDTKFRIYSITKQFTAASILQLDQKGSLSVNDRISKYFSDYPKGDSVTLHMLLTHTSGIPDYITMKEFENISSLPVSMDSVISLFKNRPYDFLPGSKFRYSNSSYFLLGRIIEKVSGMTYEDYLNKNIFKPAGMENSGVVKKQSLLPKSAKGYQWINNRIQGIPYFNDELLFSSGGIYSTAEDLWKWEKALNGNSILSISSKGKMFKPYLENYGYGVSIDSFQRHRRIAHNGVYYGFRATLVNYPYDKVCVIVLTNNESGSEQVATGLAAILFHVPLSMPYIHKEAKVDPVYLRKFIGKYTLLADKGVLFEIVKVNDKFYYRRQGENDYELKPESKTKLFFADGTNIQIEIEMSKTNEVLYYFIGEGIKYRMKKLK
jgi:CubicO group peptidase (beta-lactamase class C family)